MTKEEEEIFKKVVDMRRENELLMVLYEELEELKKEGYGCYICDDKLSGLFFAYEEYKKWKQNG